MIQVDETCNWIRKSRIKNSIKLDPDIEREGGREGWREHTLQPLELSGADFIDRFGGVRVSIVFTELLQELFLVFVHHLLPLLKLGTADEH